MCTDTLVALQRERAELDEGLQHRTAALDRHKRDLAVRFAGSFWAGTISLSSPLCEIGCVETCDEKRHLTFAYEHMSDAGRTTDNDTTGA